MIGPAGRDKRGWAVYACRCNCGALKNVMMASLKRGNTRSCGCLKAEHNKTVWTKHGHASGGYSKEYRAYAGAKSRCMRPTTTGYENYGGRGIQFLFHDFQEFISHVGPKPDPLLTLDRIDNDGPYALGNVRWATRSEQKRNQRKRRWHHRPSGA